VVEPRQSLQDCCLWHGFDRDVRGKWGVCEKIADFAIRHKDWDMLSTVLDTIQVAGMRQVTTETDVACRYYGVRSSPNAPT
jgi:hypothetical protein